MDYKYVYLLAVLCGIPFWLLFFSRRRLRKKMLAMGFFGAAAAPLSQLLHRRDYWQPLYALSVGSIGLEDVFAGFLLGGISSVLYQAAFSRSNEAVGPSRLATSVVMLVGGTVGMLVLTLVLRVNSTNAAILISLGFGTYVIRKRPELLPAAIGNGLLMGLLFAAYVVFLSFFPRIFEVGWKLERLSGMFVAGIPLEEMVWGFSWGFVAGTIYEFWAGLRLVPRWDRGDNHQKSLR